MGAKEVFAAAGIRIEDLIHVPGAAIHKTQVEADAYYDANDGRLMFVGHKGHAMRQFLYYIGEEENGDVIGVGPGISAWQIDDERGEWIIRHVEAYAKATAPVTQG